MYRITIIGLLVTPIMAFAHGGHDHGTHKVKAQKGGVIKVVENVYLELLQDDHKVKIFIFNKEAKLTGKKLVALLTKTYKVSASATRPRKKVEKIEIVTKPNHWEITYDAKGAHRYELAFKIQDGKESHTIKWNVEPYTH